MTFGFLIHSNTCYGCKTCSIACKNDKSLAPNVFLRRVRNYDLDRPGTAFVSMSCNHCDNPACVEVCPQGAYTKREDGLVVQDHDLCIGCQMCIRACPFSAPSFDADSMSTYKCDGCYERQERGLLPNCVAACPGDNIEAGDFDSLAGGEAAESVKDQAATSPNLKVILDPDMALDAFADIDHATGIVDLGSEYANATL